MTTSVAAQYPPGTVEVFAFDVAPGETNSSFTVKVGWPDRRAAPTDPPIDLDVYIYRQRPNGTLDPNPIATAASLADPEVGTYSSPIADQVVKPGRYIVAVHNYCSNETDPIPAGQDDPATPESENPCAGLPDLAGAEDTWAAEVTFQAFTPSNRFPAASLSGPASGRVGQPLTFTAAAADPDGGTIRNYTFDLDGDGRFEFDSNLTPTATASFAAPGTYSVGVRVIDDRGGKAFATTLVTIAGATVISPTKLATLASFRLTRPVFGGRSRRALAVRYRLRAAADVTIRVYRGGKRVKRYKAVRRAASRTYTKRVSAKGLRRGTYRIRITVRPPGGRAQVEQLRARLL